MAKVDLAKTELQPGQFGHVLELLKEHTIEVIGVIKSNDPVDGDIFRNVVLRISEGKVTYGALRSLCLTEEQVINDATEWIDKAYYD